MKNEMTPKMKSLNNIRIFCLIIGWILAIAIAFNFSKSLPSEDFFGKIFNFFVALFLGCFIGGIFPGLAHSGEALKSIRKLLYIFVIGWIIWFWLVCIIAMFSGAIFLVVDTIHLIMRKPLVSEKEMKKMSEEEQAEQLANTIVNTMTTQEMEIQRLREENERLKEAAKK
ncbi:MAG: hypothetical protein IJ397_09205 [Lachnospiraceae bacterium]|nr:hypothetical protein [Lachnospiraceae bacterium]